MMLGSFMKIDMTFNKTCVGCKKPYTSKVRHQKYCTPECGKKFVARKQAQQERYEEIKEFERVRVASHRVGVRMTLLEVEKGIRKGHCEYKSCKCTDSLEVHHVDLDWLNNSFKNRQYLCIPHHKKVHSDLVKELDKRGILLDEYRESTLGYLSKIFTQ